jgi:hypothetical protein
MLGKHVYIGMQSVDNLSSNSDIQKWYSHHRTCYMYCKHNSLPGYEEKELTQIREVSAIIKKHCKDSPECSGSEVLMATIYVCVNNKECSVPFPVFRIPGCIQKVRNCVMLHLLI